MKVGLNPQVGGLWEGDWQLQDRGGCFRGRGDAPASGKACDL